MTISSFGDLSLSLQLRRDSARVTSDLARITSELSRGVVSDVAGQLRGDFSSLAGFENSLARLDGFRSVIQEQTLFLSTQQDVMQKLRDIGSVSISFLTLPSLTNSAFLDNVGAEARLAFDAALRALNTQVGGRSVFSGVETNQPTVAEPDVMLTAIEADIALAGATRATDIEAVVDTWFDVGGGFETIGYLGGPGFTTALQLSDTEVVQLSITGGNEAIRDQLAALSLAALVGRGNTASPIEEQVELLQRSGEKLLASNEQLVNLQARVGNVEASVGRASAEISAQRDALQLAKSELIEVDPFKAATELQNAETQLQTIYTLTSRLSQLSLVNFL